MTFLNRLFKKREETPTVTTQLTFKERIAALQNLPRFFKMVWQTNKWMTIANALLRLFLSASPLAILYVGKLIVDQVILISTTKATAGNYLWKLVALEFGLAILSDILSRSINLMDSLLGDLFSNFTSIKIINHAATLDLEQFENSTFYDKMERARQQTIGRTILLSQVFSQVQDIITIAFLSAGLLAFNPWLIVMLVVAILPAFLGEAYFNDKTYALSRRQTPEKRELDYVRFLGASDETAKEVKMFNLSGFIVDRFRQLSNRFYVQNKNLAIRRTVWGALLAMFSSAGYYGAYVFIIGQTITGSITIGSLTFLAGSFRQLRSLMETILIRFNSVSQGLFFATPGQRDQSHY
jgi:ATP-binding cassette subfamily B protein